MNAKRVVHVAVAVIRDAAGRVLVAQRLPHQHLAGLWEFPGGKIEPGETLFDGMRREIREELGIEVEALAPLLRIEHAYPEKTVLLDVWRVLRWNGNAPAGQGAEGQPLRWVHPQEMNPEEFPGADVPIIKALNLPGEYIITPDIVAESAADSYVAALRYSHPDSRLIQVRLKQNPSLTMHVLASLRKAFPAARIFVNSDTCALLAGGDDGDAVAGFRRLQGADGLHLTAQHLQSCGKKPVEDCSASCHDQAALARAFALDLDFVTLSPVCVTASHPRVPGIGWERFAELARGAGLPVYALGGMDGNSHNTAVGHGAIGIAGISAYSGG